MNLNYENDNNSLYEMDMDCLKEQQKNPREIFIEHEGVESMGFQGNCERMNMERGCGCRENNVRNGERREECREERRGERRERGCCGRSSQKNRSNSCNSCGNNQVLLLLLLLCCCR